MKLTIVALFCSLREQLVDAREQKNVSRLETLMGTFVLIEEAAGAVQDKVVYALAEALEDAARDSLMEADWKSQIPSAEDLRRPPLQPSGLNDQSESPVPILAATPDNA